MLASSAESMISPKGPSSCSADWVRKLIGFGLGQFLSWEWDNLDYIGNIDGYQPVLNVNKVCMYLHISDFNLGCGSGWS